MKPHDNKWLWFYNDWQGTRPSFGGDEYGRHTLVVPIGKGRAICVAFWPCYLFNAECNEARQDTLRWYQDIFYVQTYLGLEDLDDVFNEEYDSKWYEALGLFNEGARQ